jgi:hypothetical protein
VITKKDIGPVKNSYAEQCTVPHSFTHAAKLTGMGYIKIEAIEVLTWQFRLDERTHPPGLKGLNHWHEELAGLCSLAGHGVRGVPLFYFTAANGRDAIFDFN